MQRPVLLLAALLASSPSLAQQATFYKLPPRQVVDLVDAPPAPQVFISPSRSRLMRVDYKPWPSISLIARPFLGLGGLRVDPGWSSLRRVTQLTGISIEDVETRLARRVALPPDAQIDGPVWSPDGSAFAFTQLADGGLKLWIGDPRTATAKPVENVALNDVLGLPFRWNADGKTLLVRLIPPGRGRAPELPRVPAGPVVEQSNGRRTTMMTYEDLLKDPHDADLFDHYGLSQLATIDAATGKVTTIGRPAMVSAAASSPDGRYVLVTRIRKPYSYHQTAASFPRNVEVWDAATGGMAKLIAGLRATESDGNPNTVVAGARNVAWDPNVPATLVWAESLEGPGFPGGFGGRGGGASRPASRPSSRPAATRAALYRDQVLSSAAPFTDPPKQVLRLTRRLVNLQFTSRPDEYVLTEGGATDRDRRRQVVSFADMTATPPTFTTLADYSTDDAYGNPGTPVNEPGRPVVMEEGDFIYLTGLGASPEGERPFLDKLNVRTGEKTRVFQSPAESHDRFVTFAGADHARIITYGQSPSRPPDYYLKKLTSGDGDTLAQLTTTADPHPELTHCAKQLLTYKRADGVGLSATLYLPPGYDPASGKKLPTLIWAYPREYADADAAAQVRVTANKFTSFWGTSPLMFLTQGYAVLMDASMPVLGPARTMNDTYLEQTIANAKAAVDATVATGYADPGKFVVMGHSYGAFMTANLLAHTDLFAAGIARSGAYNRTLTPFGFQNETRWFWAVPDLYGKMSPFNSANLVRSPILLIHGMADNNTGTYTVQSERFYDALAGNGATARLVLLPHEAHAYQARESILDCLAESFEWADRYAKNRPASQPTTTSRPATAP